MILDIQCSSIALNNFFYITKTILNIIMIVAPILAIFSGVLIFFQLTSNPDNKKLVNKLKNATIALIVLFFIPLFVNLTMALIGNKTSISECYNTSQKLNSNSTYIRTTNGNNRTIITDSNQYDVGYQRQLDFSCRSKILKGWFSCDTIHIVERHMTDLNYYNFYSVINNYGGFENYAKSLGGVFKKYYGKQPKVTTAYEFQQVAEYVFGFMTMYGFDYSSQKKYCKWGGKCMFYTDLENARRNNTLDQFVYPTGTSDAFYPGQFRYEHKGTASPRHFDNAISGKNGLNMTTNCNNSTDMVFYKAGIFGQGRTPITSSTQYRRMYESDQCKIIKDLHDVKVGDIVEFFHSKADPDNINTWRDWYHVAFVGEVNPVKETFTVYETGSGFTGSRRHTFIHDMNKPEPNNIYIRILDLE